ncbi:hypothetical protein BDR22DRAFT_888334 [Usnea florida]
MRSHTLLLIAIFSLGRNLEYGDQQLDTIPVLRHEFGLIGPRWKLISYRMQVQHKIACRILLLLFGIHACVSAAPPSQNSSSGKSGYENDRDWYGDFDGCLTVMIEVTSLLKFWDQGNCGTVIEEVVGDVNKSIDVALEDVKAICEPEEVVEEVVEDGDRTRLAALDDAKAVCELEEVVP